MSLKHYVKYRRIQIIGRNCNLCSMINYFFCVGIDMEGWRVCYTYVKRRAEEEKLEKKGKRRRKGVVLCKGLDRRSKTVQSKSTDIERANHVCQGIFICGAEVWKGKNFFASWCLDLTKILYSTLQISERIPFLFCKGTWFVFLHREERLSICFTRVFKLGANW